MHWLLHSFCDRRRHTLWRRQLIAVLLTASLFLQSATAVAPQPGWWLTHDVLAPGAVADDFAAVNIGQLKYIATQAAAAMNAALPDGAGEPINDLITSWSQPASEGVVRDDYSALTQGQLKSVAQLFYDRLGLDYPWAGGEAQKDDELWVNIGQLKYVFSFELSGSPSIEGFAVAEAAAQASWNLLDEEERPENSSLDDLDGDGIPNVQEYRMGHALFDPADLDGDRILDEDEDDHPAILSKLRFADAVEDPDDTTGDGVMNYEEILLGLDPAVANSSGVSGLSSDADVLLLAFQRGGPLTYVSDPLMATWLILDEAWFTAHGMSVEDYFGHWLAPGGLTDFTSEFWAVNMGYGGFYSEDHDWDGMPNLWEYRYELNLHDNSDAQDDPDTDSLTNYDEYLNGTNPLLADTDGDGFNDSVEIEYGGDPTDSEATPPVRLTQTSSAWLSVTVGVPSPSLMVRAMRGDLPVPGVAVAFQINAGSGLLAGGSLRAGNAAASTGATVTLTTGANGIATASYLAPGITPGSASVTASLVDDGTENVSFGLNVLAGPVVVGTPPGGPSMPVSGQPQKDTDRDGMPDDWELAHGLSHNVDSASADRDGDTYTDLEEYLMKSDPNDRDVHPGPVIQIRRKSYSSHYDEYQWDSETPTQKRFYGQTRLSEGADYLYIPQKFVDGHPVNMDDQTDDIYNAFKGGSYDDPVSNDYFLSTYGDYVWAVLSRTESPLGFEKSAGGQAIQLRIMPGGSGTKAPKSWCRSYLVVEYVETVGEGSGSLLTMPVKRILGSLRLSTDDKGNPAIDLPANSQGQVRKLGKDRVEIMPRQVEGKVIKISVLPLQMLQPAINAAGEVGPLVPTSAPRLSRWASTRGPNFSVHEDDRSKFPDSDPDRLVLRMPTGFAPTPTTLNVQVSTSASLPPAYNDPGAVIDFGGSSGYFESKPVVLVSDADDDLLPIGTGTPEDNTPNDRSFIARPGGSLDLQLQFAGFGPVKIATPVRRFSHQLEIKNIIVGVPSADPSDCIDLNTRRAKEIYAQNDIQVQSAGSTDTLSSNDLEDVGIISLGTHFRPEYHLTALLTAVDKKVPQSDTMKIVWLPLSLYSPDGSGPTYGLNLPSRPDICLMFLPDMNVSADAAMRTSHVVAHEMGHGLGLATAVAGALDHIQPDGTLYPGYHLMARGTNSHFIIPGQPDKSSKHWFLIDGETVRNNARFCKPIP